MAILWELDPAGATIVDGRTEQIPLTATVDLVDVDDSATGPSVVVDGARTILHLDGAGGLTSNPALTPLPPMPSVGHLTVVYGAPITAYMHPSTAWVVADTGDDWVLQVGADDIGGDLISVRMAGVTEDVEFTPDDSWHVLTVTWDAAVGFVVYLDGTQIAVSTTPFLFASDIGVWISAETYIAGWPSRAGTRLAVVRAESGVLADPAAHAVALLAEYGDIPLDIAGVITWSQPAADGGLPVTKYLVDLFVGGELLHAELGPEPNSLNGAPFVFDIFDFLGGPATGFVQVRAVNAAGASSPSLALEF